MTKCLPRVFEKVSELGSEKVEIIAMMNADVLSKVEEGRYREIIKKKQKRFLSQKRLEYNRWVKDDKKKIFEGESERAFWNYEHTRDEVREMATDIMATLTTT